MLPVLAGAQQKMILQDTSVCILSILYSKKPRRLVSCRGVHLYSISWQTELCWERGCSLGFLPWKFITQRGLKPRGDAKGQQRACSQRVLNFPPQALPGSPDPQPPSLFTAQLRPVTVPTSKGPEGQALRPLWFVPISLEKSNHDSSSKTA